MYNPEKIIIENIGPIERISYDFSNKVVLLTGDNQTDEGQDSNGSGKSYVLECISYATTGTSFRKVTDGELVREGQKEGYIFFQAYNKVYDRRLVIERTIYSGNKSSKLTIAINGLEQKQITSVNEGNKFVLDELGLSREDILNYFMISKEKYKSFFSSSDKDKKDLISRFSKANLVDNLFPFIEKDKKVKTDAKIALEKSIISTESKIETLREQDDLEELKKQEEVRDFKIIEHSETIEKLEKENKEKLASVKDIEKSIKQLEKKVKEIPDVTNLKEKLQSEKITLEQLKIHYNKSRKERGEIEELIADINRNLAGVVECPKCGHNFNAADPDFDVEVSKATKEELSEIITELNVGISQSKVDQEKQEKELEKIQDEINKNKQLKQEVEIKINAMTSSKSQLEKSIKFNEGQIVQYNKEIERLLDLTFEKSDNKQKIKLLQKQLKKDEEKLGELVLEEKFYDEWMLNFKSFKTYLANKSLDNITNYTNLYLEKLGSSIRVKFEGYKELKSGKTKEEISTRIFKFGEDKGSFGKLSGGEKARVDLATILAQSSLINSSSPTGGLNLTIVDEILESLDETGLKSVLKSMNGLDQYVILVTHGKVETSEGYNKIKIVKRNGISSLEIE